MNPGLSQRRGIFPRLRSYWDMMTSTIGGFLGGYTSTDPRNDIMRKFRPRGGSANELLASNLPLLRNQSRDLERKNPSARAVVEGLAANVVGTGIALEPDTGDETTNAKIREQWLDFITCVTVDGLDLYRLEDLSLREQVVAGEFIWRYVIDPDLAAAGQIPLRVILLESEWIADFGGTPEPGNSLVAGVESTPLGRTAAIWMRNPDGTASPSLQRVPVAQLNHGFDKRRALQCRGEPWMAPVIETFFQERELVRAELAAARNTAAMSVVITSKNPGPPGVDENGEATTDIPIGAITRMFPDEDAKAFSHTRPSQQISPFRQMLRGDICGAMRLGQIWLDRDASRANYSSQRADQQINERLLSPVREQFGHMTAGRLYVAVLPYLAIRAGVPLPRAKYRLIPDETPYVNPVEDIQASLLAIAGGLSTWEKETGKRGGDRKEIWTQLAKEWEDITGQKLPINVNAKTTDNTVVQTPTNTNDSAQTDPAITAQNS